MNKRDETIYKHLMEQYKFHWDKNQYYRTEHDTCMEYYRGYRNAGDYPLIYNTSFNRILPIIHTLLSRFMDQLYQGNNIVSVKPRKRKDVDRAKSAEGILNFQLDSLNEIDAQGGSYLTMFKWFFNALTFGKGIIKAYWRKEERIGPKRMTLPKPEFDRFGNFQGYGVVDYITTEMQTVYDGPYVEVLHNKLFLPHPEYRDIQQMPQVFIVYRRSIDEVKRMADKGIYKNINELGITGLGGVSAQSMDSREAFIKSLEIESAFQTEDPTSKFKTPDVDIIEAYGKMILKNEPYEVGSGLQIKGMEEEAIVHIGNHRTILSLQKNTYGIRPLFDIGCYYHPELYWDLGMITLTKNIQEHTDTLANLRMQNVFMQINQMLKVNVNADIDPEALVWKPFGIIPVDDQEDVQPLVVPDYHSNMFMEQENFYKNTIQDIMGMYDYNMGQTPERQERVGVVYGIQCLGTFGDDRDYEILTNDGWKKFDDLNRNEKVMTLNYETDEMSWETPSDYIEGPEQDYNLVHYQTCNAEFYCTENHRLPIEREKRHNRWEREVVLAGGLAPNSHAKIPCAGRNWNGNNNWQPPFEGISRRDWCSFMGIWLSEGHIYHNKKQWSYQVAVSQEKDPKKVQRIDELLKRLPFNFKYNGHQWKIQNKEVYTYLEKFGKSGDKYIPDYIKNSSVDLLWQFLDWFFMGDGWFGNSQQIHFTTVSKRLADDLQELSLKVGLRASIWCKKRSLENPKWQDTYDVGFSNDKFVWWAQHGAKTRTEKHRCRITCLTVPNGLFLIRVNNKPIWTGNSMGEARAKLLLMSMDYLGIRPLLKYMMVLNTFNLPTGFEYRIGDVENQQFGNVFGADLHSDFDFSARYTAMEPALGKQARVQQLVQLAGMWAQNPWINQQQMIKLIFELNDVMEADRLIKSPQQFQQEMQQQVQMQMQAEQAKQNYETLGKLKISEKDFQEDLILGEQEHQYDMALEAIKQNATEG